MSPSALHPAFGPTPVDPRRSPYTGLTRRHWLDLADHLLTAAAQYATADGAMIRPPGRESVSGPASDGLEGFARTFMLLAYRTAGDPARPPAQLEQYLDGFAAGMRPGPHQWPAIVPRTRQALVEAAALVLGLHHSRAHTWDRLDADTQERFTAWLSTCADLEIPDNNWHWFRVLAGTFLQTVGAPQARRLRRVTEADLARLEEFYVTAGWYRDGAGDAFDHYCGWAMQHYPLMWERMEQDLPAADRRSTAWQQRSRERLGRYLQDFPALVGSNGAPLHQGRSLIYRWAAATPVVMPFLAPGGAQGTEEIVGIDQPFSPGAARHLTSAMLRHFIDRGALGGDGLPGLGWFGPFPPLVQPYSAPASPFWAAKPFAALLLDPDHPFWTDTEQEWPHPQPPVQIAAAHWSAGVAGGIARIVNHGSNNPGAAGEVNPLYVRLGYSTATAPVSGPAGVLSADNHTGALMPGAEGERVLTRRRRIHRLPTSEAAAGSWYEDQGVRVVTVSALRGPWEIRVSRLARTAPTTGQGVASLGPLVAYDSGWAASASEPVPSGQVGTWCWALGEEGVLSLYASPGRQGGIEEHDGASALARFASVPSSVAPATEDEVVVSVTGLTRLPATPDTDQERIEAWLRFHSALEGPQVQVASEGADGATHLVRVRVGEEEVQLSSPHPLHLPG